MATIQVKPRAGNKSAALTRAVSYTVKRGKGTRVKRRTVTVGAVDFDADLSNPGGKLRLHRAKHGEHAELSENDLDKIRDWQTRAKGEASAQPTLATLSLKLDELLGRSICLSSVGGRAAPASPAEAGLARLDDAVHAAISDLVHQVQALRARSVQLTTPKHADPGKPAGDTELDALQTRANYIRKVLFPRFEDALKSVGLMVSKSSSRQDISAE